MQENWHKAYVNKETLPYLILAISYTLVIFSYPMPPRPGMIEVLMGIGLSAGCILLASKYHRHALLKAKWLLACILAATTLVVYPLVVGIFQGYGYGNILRDLFPVLFLTVLVPVVGHSLIDHEREKIKRIFLVSILFVGTVSAVEFLVDATNKFGSPHEMSQALSGSYNNKDLTGDLEAKRLTSGTVVQAGSDLDAKRQTPDDAPLESNFSVMALHAFEPAVLFTAIYGGCLAIISLMSRQIIRALFLSSLSGICAYCLLILRMRAPSFLLATMISLFVIIVLARSNRNMRIRISVIVAILLSAIVFSAWDIIVALIEKQMAVGLNGKNAELIVVFDSVTQGLGHFLFGYGWGAEFYPAYQPFPVRFTHSVITFVLLKAGLVGLIAFLMVYFQLAVNLIRGIIRNSLKLEQWAIILSSIAILVVGMAFQPTYKMLGFSFVAILAFMSVTSNHQEKS